MQFSAIQECPLYTALNSHYCTHNCKLFSEIQQNPLYTVLNSHYCTPHLYVIFSHSTVTSIYGTKQLQLHTKTVSYFQPFNSSLYVMYLTATIAHHICMLISAIQQFPLYSALNSLDNLRTLGYDLIGFTYCDK